jgi:predicted RNA-binding Zn-ribbon protein involved in translation (DUF1610 family)
MAQNNNGGSWENTQKPNNLGGMLVCPNCGQEVIGPFSATTAQNKIVKKWGCSSCSYVWKLEGGNFRSAFDANPVTFG